MWPYAKQKRKNISGAQLQMPKNYFASLAVLADIMKVGNSWAKRAVHRKQKICIWEEIFGFLDVGTLILDLILSAQWEVDKDWWELLVLILGYEPILFWIHLYDYFECDYFIFCLKVLMRSPRVNDFDS